LPLEIQVVMVGHRDFTFKFCDDSSKMDSCRESYEVSSHDDSSQCRNQWLDVAIRWSVRVMFFLLTFAGETERTHIETFLTL